MEDRFNESTGSGDRAKTKVNYSNDEITVVWKPHLCIHSTHCFKELPSVFKPLQRKWVDVNGASSDSIIVQVKRCPSGALSYFLNEKRKKPTIDNPPETWQ